jgi:hypothetical protein
LSSSASGRIEVYTAYGLTIGSELPLPELLEAAAPPQVQIRLGRVSATPPPEQGPFGWTRVAHGAIVIHWNQAATFEVRDGCEIVVDPLPGVADEVLRVYLLGSALGALLQQRGWLTLHASSVAIGGRAVAFLASSGWGKSTLAAALHAQGHALIADDVTAVQVDGEEPIVYPGFPQFKLWPDAVAALGDAAERLPRLYAGVEKRRHRVAAGFAHNPLPLHRVYVLADGSAPAIEPLSPRQAFLELMRHSYSARVLAGATMTMAEHFARCSRLAGQVAISRLRRPQDLSLLPELARRVEQDAGSAQV